MWEWTKQVLLSSFIIWLILVHVITSKMDLLSSTTRDMPNKQSRYFTSRSNVIVNSIFGICNFYLMFFLFIYQNPKFIFEKENYILLKSRILHKIPFSVFLLITLWYNLFRLVLSPPTLLARCVHNIDFFFFSSLSVVSKLKTIKYRKSFFYKLKLYCLLVLIIISTSFLFRKKLYYLDNLCIT